MFVCIHYKCSKQVKLWLPVDAAPSDHAPQFAPISEPFIPFCLSPLPFQPSLQEDSSTIDSSKLSTASSLNNLDYRSNADFHHQLPRPCKGAAEAETSDDILVSKSSPNAEKPVPRLALGDAQHDELGNTQRKAASEQRGPSDVADSPKPSKFWCTSRSGSFNRLQFSEERDKSAVQWGRSASCSCITLDSLETTLHWMMWRFVEEKRTQMTALLIHQEKQRG